jgi:predicted DsbA family dithiol-disulfide isomerase
MSTTPYRKKGKTSLADLEASEMRILAQLARVLVRSDAEVSEAERAQLELLANEAGDSFWKVMEEVTALEETSDEIVKKAAEVGDKDAHELIYGALYELSIRDGIDAGENDVLDKLAAGWNLEIENVAE